ncbi:MAG: phosphonate C-P lyase system protein PhnH [Pseudomonadota bacterium]
MSTTLSEASPTPAQAPNPALALGFREPVHDAQETFTAIMDAMARPGLIKVARPAQMKVAQPGPLKTVTLPQGAPVGLHLTTASVLLTLLDHDSSVSFDATLDDQEGLRRWNAFHTGAPVADSPADADFAVLATFDETLALDEYRQGEPSYPDRSTTLIIQVDRLQNGAGWRLTGPGIQTEHLLDVDPTVEPAGASFLDQWNRNRGQFPLGVDIVLCAPDAIACLPRTVKIEAAMAEAGTNEGV